MEQSFLKKLSIPAFKQASFIFCPEFASIYLGALGNCLLAKKFCFPAVDTNSLLSFDEADPKFSPRFSRCYRTGDQSN